MAGRSDLQLRLMDGTNTFTFDFDGQKTGSKDYQWNENNEPPELRSIDERWSFRQCRITGSSPEDVWDKLNLFFDATDDRATSPLTSAVLVRDPDNAQVVEDTLGGSGQEGFRVERIEWGHGTEDIEELAHGQFRSLITVDIELAAVQIFGDGNGISAWEQTIRHAADASGLDSLEWETSISVSEGSVTTALSLAQLYAVIPIASLGTTYTWATNSENGFDYEEVNPDSRTGKTPTRLRVISRVQRQGITVGTPTAGNSVGDVEKVVATHVKANVTRTVTTARATGPGAEAWVLNQDPGGDQVESIVTVNDAKRKANGRWVVDDSTDSESRIEVAARISGGYADFEFVPVSGGAEPQFVPGPFQPWRCDVVLRVIRFGPRPQNNEMKFPPQLDGARWRLNRNLSREDAIPKMVNPGKDGGQAEWVREAELVYLGGGAQGTRNQPPVTDLEVLFDAPSKTSYFFL